MKNDSQADTIAPGASAGATLSEERKRQGMSLSDVARQIKLSPRQVEALERDDFASFRGAVFVHGFLRNYARLLRIDAAPLVKAADALLNPAPRAADVPSASKQIEEAPLPPIVTAHTAPAMHAASPTGRDEQRNESAIFPTKMLLLGVTALVIVVIGYLVGHAGWRTQPTRDVRATAETSRPAQVADALAHKALEPQRPRADPVSDAKPQDEKKVETRPSEMNVASVSSVPDPTTKPDPTAKLTATEEPLRVGKLPDAMSEVKRVEPMPAPEQTANVPSVGTVERATLHMVFQQESWVEVKDAGGKTIFAQLNPAGSERSLKAQSPMSVVVGNANGVSISVNDRAISLEPHTRVNVARLTLP